MSFRLLFTALLVINSSAFGSALEIEEIEFVNSGAKLAGSIVYSRAVPVSSAVVFVHGSGPQIRNMEFAKAFAEHGIATLVYDKRGAGASGGSYEEKRSVGEDNLRLLAADASSAVDALKSHRLFGTVPIGLVGISQAGWIVPIAAQRNQDIAFIVLWSGPVCKVSEEDIYSKYTKDLDQGKLPSYQDALQARTSEYRWPDWLGEDMNPRDSLLDLDIPGLWVFGGRDGSIPVGLSIARLSQLIEAGSNHYAYVYFSALGHNNIGPTMSTVVDWIKRL